MDVSHHQRISDKIHGLANYITELHFQHHPELLERYGEAGKVRCHEDAVFHLEFLIEAMKMDHPDLYAHYIHWAAAMLSSRNIPESDLMDNLDYLQQAIEDKIGKNTLGEVLPFINLAKEQRKQKPTPVNTHITGSNPLKTEVETYLNLLLAGKRQEAANLIHQLVNNGVSVKDIYEHIFQVSQYEVGLLWQCNKISVAHEHYCTAATQFIMAGLYQYIFATGRVGKTLVASAVSGELHEMGIRMLADFFEMEGWDTYYLGANMPDRQLQEALIEHQADVLAISVTLPTYVSTAAQLIAGIRQNPQLSNIKIMAGGYPFLNNPGLWQKVGADAFAQNANEAIDLAGQLTNL